MSVKQAQLKVLLTHEQQKQIRELAEWQGLDVSSYIRSHIKLAHREMLATKNNGKKNKR